MKLYSLFRAVPVLFTLALSSPILSAQVVVPLASRADDMAVAYLGGSPFKTGDQISDFLLGNINTNPTRQLGLLKFEISSFAGLTASNVTLNLPITDVADYTGGDFPVQTVNIYALNYGLGAGAFTVNDANTEDVTLIGSLALSGSGFVANFDLTSGFATAQANGFDYFAIRLENITVLDGPFGQPAFVYATLNPTLEVTAVPEPSTYAMLGLALVVVTVVVQRRGLITNQA